MNMDWIEIADAIAEAGLDEQIEDDRVILTDALGHEVGRLREVGGVLVVEPVGEPGRFARNAAELKRELSRLVQGDLEEWLEVRHG